MDSKGISLEAFLAHNFRMDSPIKKIPLKRRKAEVNTPKILVKHNYREVMEVEVVLVEDLILPLTFVMKYAIPFHDTIVYDYAEKQFLVVKGSLQRKVFCILWQFIIIYKLSLKVVPALSFGFAEEESGGQSAVTKGAHFIFVCFSFVTFYVYWRKSQSICDIFNHILGLSEKLHLKQKSPPRIKIVKCVAHFAWSFVLGYVLLTIALHLLSVFKPELTEVTKTLNTTKNGTDISSKKKQNEIDFTGIHTNSDVLIIQVISAVSGFINLYGWMMTFLHWGLWSMLFRQLIMLFYWKIETIRSLGQYFVIPQWKLLITQEIRTFNKIGCIIDQFNQAYGFACLFGAVCVVTYISPSLKNVAPGFQNLLKMSSGIHLLLSYIPMGVTSFLAAEVQRVAGNFAGIIKEEYGRFTKECGDAAEGLCGIAIVHYDLVTANIGIKGSGFFTVSYQFITTIASLIVTYSILVIQLFPQDNTIDDI